MVVMPFLIAAPTVLSNEPHPVGSGESRGKKLSGSARTKRILPGIIATRAM
jgi:hypothetical protein